MNNNRTLSNDLRIIVIKKDGSVDAIFSADDGSCKNTILLNADDEVSKIEDFYNEIKDSVYHGDDMKDRHLFYVKQYLNNNFSEELKARDININNTYDDLLIYYHLTNMDNIVLVNSNEHNNFIIIPSNGINDIQKEKFSKLPSIFPDDYSVEEANNLHLEKFESDGKIYATLEIGDTRSGTIEEIASSYRGKAK